MSLPTERTEHFVLKEDGKIYWIDTMPDSYYYVQNAQGWRAAVLSAISNAVEVSNQKEVLNTLMRNEGQERSLHSGTVYPLQCVVEKRETGIGMQTGLDKREWTSPSITALVTFSQPEREETQEELMSKVEVDIENCIGTYSNSLTKHIANIITRRLFKYYKITRLNNDPMQYGYDIGLISNEDADKFGLK